jgi:hypothetical protein
MDEDLEDEDLIAQGNDTNGDISVAPGVSINTPVTLFKPFPSPSV